MQEGEMLLDSILTRDFSKEFVFNASRSSGPGGQNVNKVNSKIELRFNISESSMLSEEEKALIFEKLATKITDSGEIVVVSQSERSQMRNKELAIEKFTNLLVKAFTIKKVRKPTKTSRAAKEKRLEKKRITSLKKESRKNPLL
jgi:ribosome-associated protein